MREIHLPDTYGFMYENFMLATQGSLYLFIKEHNGVIHTIYFERVTVHKYGYPNDEAGHPLIKYGLGIYGFFVVGNSQWIEEIKKTEQLTSAPFG